MILISIEKVENSKQREGGGITLNLPPTPKLTIQYVGLCLFSKHFLHTWIHTDVQIKLCFSIDHHGRYIFFMTLQTLHEWSLLIQLTNDLSICFMPSGRDTVINQTEVTKLPIPLVMFNEWLHSILLSTYYVFFGDLFFWWRASCQCGPPQLYPRGPLSKMK